MEFPITRTESDCDGSYSYQSTIDIDLVAVTIGLACDIRYGGYRFKDFCQGDRVQLNEGDIKPNQLVFTVDSELFSVDNSSDVTGEHWNIGIEALDRFGKVLLCN